MQLFNGFIKSFYSPSHYESTALDTKGICLSYLFGLATLLFIIGIGTGIYYIEGNVEGLLKLLEIKITSQFPAITFGSFSGMLLILLGFIVIIFHLSLLLLNYAVTIAVLSQPLNRALNAELDFAQLLRIAAYAQVPAFIFFAAILFFILQTNAVPSALMIGCIWLFTHGFYMLFAIASTRSTIY